MNRRELECLDRLLIKLSQAVDSTSNDQILIDEVRKIVDEVLNGNK
jgi:FtsZ-binding cell division protein ZapB